MRWASGAMMRIYGVIGGVPVGILWDWEGGGEGESKDGLVCFSFWS